MLPPISPNLNATQGSFVNDKSKPKSYVEKSKHVAQPSGSIDAKQYFGAAGIAGDINAMRQTPSSRGGSSSRRNIKQFTEGRDQLSEIDALSDAHSLHNSSAVNFKNPKQNVGGAPHWLQKNNLITSHGSDMYAHQLA
jgi:hypothetical protein